MTLPAGRKHGEEVFKTFQKISMECEQTSGSSKKTLEMCHCLKNIAAYFKSLTLSEA